MPEKLAELAGAAEGPVAAAEGWHELAVANPTFLLERLGSENAAFAENGSEALGAPDELPALQQIHWQIHKAHCDYQRVAEERRRLAADRGEIIRTLLDELMAAAWSETEARDANTGGLAGSDEAWMAAPDNGSRNEMPAASPDRGQGSAEAR